MFLHKSDGTSLQIIGTKREEGRVVSDPDHLVAGVKLRTGKQRVTLDVYDRAYEKQLRQLFSEPLYRFNGTAQSPANGSADAGLQEIQPWHPDALAVLPGKLFAMGLRFIVAGNRSR